MNSCMWAAVHLSEDEDKLRTALIIILESAKESKLSAKRWRRSATSKHRDHQIYGLSGNLDWADG